jgi:hypothetical protein
MQFNSSLIRKALRDTPIDISVEDARYLYNVIKKRIKNGEEQCYICVSANRMFGERTKRSIFNFFDTNGISVMENKNEIWIANYNDYLYPHAGDLLRLKFLRILVDMKRNRKGKPE